MSKRETKQVIAREALIIAIQNGIEAVTIQSVADRIGESRQFVGYHFSIDELREAVERCAFERAHPSNLAVRAHAITGPRSARYQVTPAQLAEISQWIAQGRA